MPQTVEIEGVGTAEFPDEFTPDQISAIIKRDYGDKTPKTSALGAFGRAAGAAVGPTAAAMAAFGGGAEVGAGFGAFGGPLDPITIPAGALIGGGLAAGAAAFGVSKAQHAVASAIAPQTVEKLDQLREADIVEHPVATAAGDIAAMLPSAEVAPFRTAYGLSKVPSFLWGKASAANAKLAKDALTQVGAQAALQVGQSLATEHKLPSAAELAEGTVAAMLFHEPKFRLLPKATAAAAAALTEKGKSLYARSNTEATPVHGNVRTQPGEGAGQVSQQEGGSRVRAEAEGGLAKEAQIPLKKNARITLAQGGGYDVELPAETGSSKFHAKTRMEADAIAEALERGKIPPGHTPEGPHVQEMTPEEIDQYEQQEREGMALDKQRQDDLNAAAERLGVKLNLTDETGPGDVPFAGNVAWVDKSGTVNVNRRGLRNWLSGIPEEQHPGAIESLVDEEHVHSKVTDEQARAYWNDLSFPEKLLVNKRYTGRLRGLPDRFGPTQMGHEALRGRIQQLTHMTPREVADAVGDEHWTNRAVYALEKVIASIREFLGTKASARQREILDKVMGNLEIAKGLTQPFTFDRHAEVEEIGKEIGFDVKRNDFPGMKAEGMPPEMVEKMKQVVQPVWEFTNRKSPEDDPMGGHTFYVPEGASRADIIRRYNEIRKQYGQPPEAYNRRLKETDKDRAIRELHEAQIQESSARRRRDTEMAFNPQELAEAKDKLKQAWANALDQNFPQAYNRRTKVYKGWEDEGEFYRQRQRLQDEMVLVDGHEAKKGTYGHLAATKLWLYGDKEARKYLDQFEYRRTHRDEFPHINDEEIRQEAPLYQVLREMLDRRSTIEIGPHITPPEVHEVDPNQQRFGGELDAPSYPPEAFDRRAAEELKRRKQAERVHRKYLKQGETGQSEFFMPPSAEKWVEPISAEQGGAIMGLTKSEIGETAPAPKMTSLELTGVHGVPGVPDKPGLVDDYLNEPIRFSAAPRTREAEVQGEKSEFTEYRRRSERPSFKGFVELVKERFHAYITEDKLREIWTDAVWRHLERASPEQLVDWARSSNKKALASWQTGSVEEQAKRLSKEFEAQHPKGPQEIPTGYQYETKAGEFGLEQEVVGMTQKEMDKARKADFYRLRREQAAQVAMNVKRASKNWNTIVTEVGQELLSEAKPPEQPVVRQNIYLDDIDYGNENTDEGVVRDISASEARDPQVLSSILADQSRGFMDAQDQPVSYTKRLVAILDRQTGRVHLVSSYPHGRSGAVLVDPEKAGISDRPNIPLADLLARKFGTTDGPQDRYRPIQSLLLTNPVKNFHTYFKDVGEYFEVLGRDAAENARAQEYAQFTGESSNIEGALESEQEGSSSEEPPDRPRGTEVTEGEGGGAIGPHGELVRGPQGIGKSLLKRTMRMPIQPSEALALQNYVLEQAGPEPTLEGMVAAIDKAVEGGYRGAQRKAVSAIVKATQKAYDDYRAERLESIRARRDAPKDKKHLWQIIEKSEKQVYEETIKKLHQAITSTDTAADYIGTVTRHFGRETGQQLSPHGQAITEPSAKGVSREVTIGTVGGRDIFGRPVLPRRGTPPSRFGLAPERPEGSPGVFPPPERLQGPPAGIPAQEQGIRGGIPQTEALTQRNITLDPYASGVRPYERPPRAPYLPGSMPPEGPSVGLREDPWQRLVKAQYPGEGTVPTGYASREEQIQSQIESRQRALEAQDKYLPGMPPEAFDRASKRVQEEWDLLKKSVAAKFTRRQQKEDIHTQRDVADHTANVDANNSENVTKDASRPAIPEALQGKGNLDLKRRSAAAKGEEKGQIVRKAAIAVNASGEIVAGGSYYTDKFGNKRQRTYWTSNKDKLTAPLVRLEGGVVDVRQSGFIALAEEAMQQAQFSMKKADPWYQMMGRKWYAAAKELRDAAIWARDHWTDPELKRTVMTARDQLRDQWQFEADNGIRTRRDFNYAPGRYDAELWNDDKVYFGQQRVMGRNFRMPAPFNNYYEAIHAGPYIAKNLDIAALVGHRVRQGRLMVNKNLWYGWLKGTKDNQTGLPIAQEIERGEPVPIKEKGQILRDKDGKILTSPGKPVVPRGYEVVTLDNGRKQLAVLSDYKYAVESAAGESQLRNTPITREMLHFGQYLKHYGILIYDSFHPSRLFQYSAALGGNPFKYNRGRAALEYRPQDLDRAVEVGSVTKEDADWARATIKVNFGKGTQVEMTRQELLAMALQHGANVGRLQDALYAEAKHILPGVTAMNKWVFRQVTRGLMAESIVRNFEDLNKRHPDIPASTLMRDVVKDMNFFYGSIGRQGILKSPLLRDFAQMILLAPQWVEGLAQKESRFYSRAVGLSGALGRQGPYLGALGGAMAKGLLFYFGLSQVMNLITRGKLTFQNDEEGHKMDAFIPSGKGGFWLSPMSVFAELSHDVLRLFETKPTAWDVADQIGRNKLGPWGRMGIVLTTKQNAQGEFIPTTGGRIAAAAETLAPVPISLSHLGKTVFGSPTGRVFRTAQPGGWQRQYASSVLGIKGQPADTPLQRMTRLAQRFNASQGRQDTVEFVPTELPSYSKMRSAIRAGDEKGALMMLNDLRKTHSDTQIYHTMRTWASSPLTGSRQRERAFVASLTPEQRQTYSQAMEERLNTLQDYVSLYTSGH